MQNENIRQCTKTKQRQMDVNVNLMETQRNKARPPKFFKEENNRHSLRVHKEKKNDLLDRVSPNVVHRRKFLFTVGAK